MLEFVQKPPQSKEDVSLSESGKFVLERAVGNWHKADALGEAVCSELIDAFGEDRDSAAMDVFELSSRVMQQASEILGDDMRDFANGMNNVRLKLTQEVSA